MAYGCGHTVPHPVRDSTLQTLHDMTPIQLQETPVSFRELRLAEYFQSFSTQKSRRDRPRIESNPPA
jgi:hypothetical protein